MGYANIRPTSIETQQVKPGEFKIEESDLVIIGGGVGSLVGAATAAKAGARVSLLLSGGGIGAGFASLHHDDYLLDIGCRRFDFTTDPTKLPLEDYTPGVRTRPFANHVQSFVTDDLGLEIVATSAPQLSYEGKRAPDFATSLDLTSLPDLFSAANLAATFDETGGILRNPSPSSFMLGGTSWPDLSSATLEEASLVNHGPTFHAQVIQPFANKLFPGGWQTMPADLAAKIWTPIFFPSTINQGCRREMERGRPPVTYFYPAGGHFGEFIDRLRALIEQHPNIQIISPFSVHQLSHENGTTIARQDDGRSLQWSCPYALSMSVKDYCRLAGLQTDIEQISLDIMWIDLEESDLLADPSTIMVFDADTSIYRISFAGKGKRQGRRVIAVEMGGAANGCKEEDVVTFLVKNGILRPTLRSGRLDRNATLKLLHQALRTERLSEQPGQSLKAVGFVPR